MHVLRSLAVPAAATALAAAVLCAPAPLHAQYFGRNKVQYTAFKFDVLRSPHFDVYYYGEEREAAEQAIRIAERWYTRYTKLFSHDLHGRQPIILYASHPDFEQTNAISGELGEGTGGVTEAMKRRVVLPAGSSLQETNHVIGHELVHAYQYDITGEGLGMGQMPGAARLPLWFIEGMAEYMSLGSIDPNTAMWLRDAAQRKKLPSWRQLWDPRYFPYRWGQAFWAFIAGRYGDAMVGEILQRAGRSGDPQLAIQQVTAMRVDSLVKLWHSEIDSAYLPLEQQTHPPQVYGKLLIGREHSPGLNVAPALSPDGNSLVFYSSRSLFSIDLYLADAHTGHIKQRLIESSLDPHYQSLEFINSAGAWDAAGKRIAFGAVSNGAAILTVYNVEKSRKEREIRLDDVGEIFNPTWSPDGRYIAFAALTGGFTDLYRYDLEQKQLERLTGDPYADIEPAWSPDGREIAFVTDEFTTKLDTLVPGAYELAIMDASTGAIRRVPTFPQATKSVNPQWSPDGNALYFVADPNGIDNVYRIDLPTGHITQVTNVFTGVSGITDVSPAISIASRSGRMVFGVYEQSGYNLYAVDSEEVLLGTDVTGPLAAVSPAVLPPQDRISAELLTALKDQETGLPTDSGYVERGYSPRLSIDFVSQPSLAVGADRFGTYVGGGVALFWSDMLGNRNLVTAVQINGGFQDFSGLVAYQNTSHRWNWGVAAQQVPYYSSTYGATIDPGGGITGPAYTETISLYRQTNRMFDLLAQYPINAAERFEFAAGVNNMSFSQQVETRSFDLNSGYILYDSLTELPGQPSITLATSSAAFVYDNSLFGATSPILGSRYRLEVDPATGSINWVGYLVDFRRYYMPLKPFTFAIRGMSYGRFGSGAEDPRVTPLYLGYAALVRGYDYGSFNANECLATSCPVFDRLFGSRLLVGNAELRFPLLGVLGLGSGYFGAFPIEAAFFFDGGMAYCGGGSPLFCIGDNQPVYSTGATLRLNLFGYAVGEIDFVKPFQRPDKGWYFEFSLTPGY